MNLRVIEDREQNLNLVRYLLEARGHRIYKAGACAAGRRKAGGAIWRMC